MKRKQAFILHHVMYKIKVSKFTEDHSKDTVRAFNSSLDFLSKQKVSSLPLCPDGPATTIRQCLFSFDWVCQALLWRCCNIAEQYAKLVNENQALGATIIGRALAETVAHFHNLLQELEDLLKKGKSEKAYHLISSYSLGGRNIPETTDGKRLKLKTLHINDALRRINTRYENFQDTYDFLCEFTHPNSHGTTMSFSRPDKEKRVVRFKNNIHASTIDVPQLYPAICFQIMQFDWEEMAHVRKLLSEKWKPSIAVCDLFDLEEDKPATSAATSDIQKP